MKALIFSLFAMLAMPAFAQATLGNSNALGQTASGYAMIAPGALTVNTLPNSPITAAAVDSTIHTNQAMSAAPAFGVQGSGCVKPGSGATLQLAGAGGALAIAGDPDEGCEAPRDINTMKMSGGFTDEDYQTRACMVPKIAKTKACIALAKRQAEERRAQGVLDDVQQPVAARAPMPWQAGG